MRIPSFTGKGESTCTYFANDKTFKENGDWGNKEKKVYKLDAYGERVPQLDENGNQKLGRRNEKLWESKVRVVDRFEPNEKMAEGWRESWKKSCKSILTARKSYR